MSIQKKYNTFWNRFRAGVIDGLIFIPFIFFDYYFEDLNSNMAFIGWKLLYVFSWTLYVVIGHGKYGQTLGKKLMRLKVLDIHERGVIGFRRAFLRESVWFIADIIGIIFFLLLKPEQQNQVLRETIFVDFIGFTLTVWFLLELITMFFNNKRRAIHDYIAGSVVVDQRELDTERKQLHK